MATIALTGAKGFVGVNLLEYLKDLNKIQSISVRYNPNQTIEFKENVVIHLSGKAHDIKKVANPQEYYEANYELTKQVFDAFLISECQIFIFISSVKALTDKVNGIVSEIQMPNPKTHYGKSKLLAENYILSKSLRPNKRIYILRPCMIHGPGNKGNLNSLYQLVTKGLPWPLGSFENQRSFCSIENFCFVINEIIENTNIPSGVFNLADNYPISTNRLIELMAISQNKKAIIYKIPKILIVTLAKLGDYLKFPLNSERLQKLTESYVVSNEKIVNAIGKPLPISAEEGLIQTLKSFNKI
jgi:nucleoside-diphosphate-sugar epimerase